VPDTEQTKYEKLKGQIEQFTCQDRVDGSALASHRFDEMVPRIREQAAHRLAMALLEHGMLEFTKLEPVDMSDYDQACGSQTFRTTCWFVHPKGVDAHKKDLEKARQEGYDQAMREIEEAAEQFKGLDCYGPVIGNAMQSKARFMREKVSA
ncbi:MAG: hypothetical protein IID08_09155, partial [Candidatus Hydrogenedentes bacterium]|nr:hypothetical protein [Candidatus Hydrogenedentota bacterium]